MTEVYRPLADFLHADQFSSRVPYHDFEDDIEFKSAVSPLFKDFGKVIVGTNSSVLTVTLQNQGYESFPLKSISVPTGFSFTSTVPAGTTLPSNAQVTIQVTFKPMVVGYRLGYLVIDLDKYEGRWIIPLVGLGVPVGTVI